jgi:hypothetical protein
MMGPNLGSTGVREKVELPGGNSVNVTKSINANDNFASEELALAA